MSLSFVRDSKSYEARWINYAMLRDNVLHHLEHSKPSSKFQLLYSITEALGGKGLKLSSRELHQELLAAQEGLHTISISEFAISLRTKGAISLAWPLPDFKETELARETMGARRPFVGDPKTIGELVAPFVESLLQLTKDAEEGIVVEVFDL